MALFTDGVATNIEKLKAYESSILDVASLESIDITVKLELAHLELGFELSGYLTRSGYAGSGELNRVVFSELLAHAECLKTLELIYCDAYNSQVNDRYLGKWRDYSSRYHQALRLSFEAGLEMVSVPLPRPASAAVSLVSGGSLPICTYYVAVALQDANGYASALSKVTLVEAGTNQLLHVAAPRLPAGAVGWEIYAGVAEQSLYRQATVALGAGSAWTQDEAGLRSDLPSTPNQNANWTVKSRRTLLRG